MKKPRIIRFKANNFLRNSAFFLIIAGFFIFSIQPVEAAKVIRIGETKADDDIIKVEGKIGINTSNPYSLLEIASSTKYEGLRIISATSYTPFVIRNSANNADLFRIDQQGNITATGGVFGSNTDNYWKLSGSNLYSSSTSWNVGIGTTSPFTKLQVFGGAAFGNGSQTSFLSGADFQIQKNANNNTVLGMWQYGVASSLIGSKANDSNFYLTNNYYGEGIGVASTSVAITRDGLVGVGINNPGAKLDVNGLGKIGNNYLNVLSYNINSSIANAVKIKTNIPYQNGSQMPTVIIEGYDYGSGKPIGISVVWYVYNGNFVSHSASSWGGSTPDIKLANENGLVTITLNWQPYFARFNVRVFAQGMAESPSWFNGWTAVDEVAGTTNQVTVSYNNSFPGTTVFSGGIWNNNGSVGIGTVSLLDKLTVAGGGNFTNPVTVGTPTANGHAATKSYVDGVVAPIVGGASLWATSSAGMYNVGLGRVGIGTTNPGGKLAISGGEGTYTAPNFGNSNLGSINIYSGTSDRRNAITFSSAGSNNAQAGIYVHQDNSVGTHMYLATTDSYATGPQARLTIKNNGAVGIGTTNPNNKLDVNGGIGFSNFNSSDKKLYSPADGDLEWMTHNLAGAHGFAISHQGVKAVYLNTSGNSYINGGNVGIGTTDPSHKLFVSSGTSSISSAYFQGGWGGVPVIQIDTGYGQGAPSISLLSGSAAYPNKIRSVSDFAIETNGANERLRITSAGSVGIGTTSPSPIPGLHVVSGTGYSIYAGNKKVGQVATPSDAADASNKGYVDAAIPGFFTAPDLTLSQYNNYYYMQFGSITIPSGQTRLSGTWVVAIYGFEVGDDYDKLGYLKINIRRDASNNASYSASIANLGSDKVDPIYITSDDGITYKLYFKVDTKVGYSGFYKFKLIQQTMDPLVLAAGTHITTDTAPSGTKYTWTATQASATFAGTNNYVPKFNSAGSLTNSIIFDNGTNLGIGTNAPQDKLFVAGANISGSDVLNNDGNDRPGMSVKGSYPEINLISTTYNNASHGPTLRFVGYKDVNMNTWNHWVIGTSGNAGFLDFGYSSTSQTNPHFGISNYTGSNGYTFMRIASTGDVGIGTISPGYKLEVIGEVGSIGVNRGFRVSSTSGDNTNSAPWYGLGQSTQNLWSGQSWGSVQLAGYAGLNFKTAGGSMVITGDTGNVGIGTTNPSLGKLQVVSSQSGEQPLTLSLINEGYGVGTGNKIQFYTALGGTNKVAQIRTSVAGNNNGDLMLDTANGTDFANVMTLKGSGNVGIGTTTPAARLQVNPSTGIEGVRIITSNFSPFVIRNSANSQDIFRVGQTGWTSIPSGLETSYMSVSSIYMPTSYGSAYFGANGYYSSNEFGIVEDGYGYNLITQDYDNDRLYVGNAITEVKSTGNIGIGLTNPSTKLEVAGSSATTFEAAGFYNTVAYGTSDKAEARINIGKIESGFAKQPMGSIGAFPVSNFDSTYGILAFYTRADQTMNERMRIMPDGNVGIGTTNPLDKLHVAGSVRINDLLNCSGTGSAVKTDASGRLVCGTVSGGITGSGSSNYISKWTGASTQTNSLIYDNGTNVGIGTASPSQKLDVSGVITASTGFRVNNGATSGQYLRGNGTNFVSSAIQASDVPTLNQNTTGSAYYLVSRDTRAVNDLPSDFNSFVKFDFKQNSTNGLSDGGTYNGVMTWRKYGTASDLSGGPSMQLAYTDNGHLWMRFSSSASAWASWRRMISENASGNVGIGTTNPSHKLQVNGNALLESGSYLYFRDTSSYINESGGLNIVAGASRSLNLAGGTGTDLTILSNGNVGVGTSPGVKLDVAGAIRANGSPSPSWGDVIGGSFNTNTTYAYNSICVGNNSGTCGSAGGVVIGINNTGASVNIPNSGNTFFNNSGNVGIGTASPIQKLTISGTSVSSEGPQSNISVFTGNGLRINGNLGNSAQDAITYQSGGGGGAAIAFGRGGGYDTFMSFYTNINTVGGAISEQMRITAAGNVGIGTISPGYKLDVNGSVGAQSFTYNSDARLKKNIKTIKNPLGKILSLRGVTFNWKDSGDASVGLIAQEVEKVFPELVNGTDIKGVEYGNLVAPLIEAVKEQQRMIDKLEARIDILEKKTNTK